MRKFKLQISNLEKNNDNFIKFGKSAQKHSEDFHWDKVVKKYLDLINN